MGKNSQVHFLLETSLKNLLEREARENRLTISQFFRQKIIQDSELIKIKHQLTEQNIILNKILKKLERGSCAK